MVGKTCLEIVLQPLVGDVDVRVPALLAVLLERFPAAREGVRVDLLQDLLRRVRQLDRARVD